MEKMTAEVRKAFAALKSENTDGVLSMMPKTVVNCINEDGETLLIAAAQYRNFKAQEKLLRNGAEINAKDKNGSTALHYSVNKYGKHNNGYVKSVELLLSSGADVNVQNMQGDSPLILAAKLGDTEIQKLLINKEANVNCRNMEGKTALHYCSEQGDFDSVQLLLARSANINIKDEDGSIPLHYAVMGNHLKAVDILVFCGADGSLIDMEKLTSEENSKMYELMLDSIQTVSAIKQGYIKVHPDVLRNGEEYKCEDLGCIITTSDNFAQTDVLMFSRRVRPEFGRNSLRPAARELLNSDTFEFRLSGEMQTGMIKIKIPLYSEVEAYEELNIKTNQSVVGETTVVDRLNISNETREDEPSEDDWFCTVNVDLRHINTFAFVTRSERERFKINKHGGLFTSVIDSAVTLNIEDGTFNTEGTITHEIIRKPEVTESDFPYLLSSTHFHDFTQTSSEQLGKRITLTLPQPSSTKDGILCIMMRSNNDTNVDPDKWTIVVKSLEPDNGKISAVLSQLNSVLVGLSMSVQPTEETIKDETETRFQWALATQRKAVFLALVKVSEDYLEASELKVECYSEPNFKKRIEYWESLEYEDQFPSFSGQFQVTSGQSFLLEIGGGLKGSSGADILLEHHPKRKNNNIRDIKIVSCNKQEESDVNGELRIFETMQTGTDIESENKSKQYTLTSKKVKADKLDIINLHIPFGITVDNLVDNKGFTGRELFDKLNQHLSEKEKKKLLHKLFIRVDNKPGSFTRMILQWRDFTLNNRDLGLPDLLLALKEMDKDDLVKYILKRLKLWMKKYKNTRTPFTCWLSDIRSEIENENTEDLVDPLSDPFFKSLAKMIINSQVTSETNSTSEINPTSNTSEAQSTAETISTSETNSTFKTNSTSETNSTYETNSTSVANWPSVWNLLKCLELSEKQIHSIESNPLYHDKIYIQIYLLLKLSRSMCQSLPQFHQLIHKGLKEGGPELGGVYEWYTNTTNRWKKENSRQSGDANKLSNGGNLMESSITEDNHI